MAKIHNKQFIIADSDIEWDIEEWKPKERRLYNGYRIYYDENLNIVFGKNGVLIGNAFQGDMTKKAPVEVLDEDIIDIADEYESWNGRWILLYKNQVHLDANAQLGLFYGKIRPECWCASSSLALINKAAKGRLEIEEFLPLDIGYKSLLYWNPGPRTLLKGIRRLMATQILYLNGERRIEYRDTINKQDYALLSPKEIYQAIFEQQKNAFDYITANYKKINIALTAGYDSRLQMAILAKANIACECHLFERVKNTARADEEIAPRIAKQLGIKYKFVPLNHGIDAKRIIDYSKHTFNNVKDMDYKWHYPYHQFDEIDGDIYVRASLYEGFCNYYSHYGMKSTYDDTVEFMMDDLRKMYITLKGNTCAEESLAEYCQWAKAHPTKNMTFMDMLAYEQLMGCWMSDTSQGMDYVWDGLVINPINSMRIFSLIVGLPREKRDERVWQAEMTNMLCPELAGIPYNNAIWEQYPAMGLRGKIKERIHSFFA